MASVSSSRRQGDEYQDIYGWFRALELLRPARKVWRVSIEDPSAGRFDDVTIRPEAGSSHAPQFCQVKFHVDEAGSYSTAAITKREKEKRNSLLDKAWETWRILRDEHADAELLLVSTYSWSEKDAVAEHIRRGGRLTPDFVNGSVTGKAAVARATWRAHLDNPGEEDFRPFLSALRFRLGYPATVELLEWTAERMELVGMRHEERDILVGAAQVERWIAEGKETIDRADMEAAVAALDLLDPGATAEPAVSLYIHTILKEPIETDGDYELDWRDYFEGGEWHRGHKVHDPAAWNEAMLPELVSMQHRITGDTSVRLLRARGKARLSAWFALGYAFPRVGGWAIEVDQNGRRWRNDAPPAEDFDLVTEVEALSGAPDVLAVGVSITGSLVGDVRAYLAEAGDPAGALLLAAPASGTGMEAIRSDGDVTRLVEIMRDAMRAALGRRPRKVLLFYFGPLSGAAFIGASLNAVAPEVQVFEDQMPGYAPSFTLRP